MKVVEFKLTKWQTKKLREGLPDIDTQDSSTIGQIFTGWGEYPKLRATATFRYIPPKYVGEINKVCNRVKNKIDKLKETTKC